MKIVAHCFAEKATITPNTFSFPFNDYIATVFTIDSQLTLQVSKSLTSDELKPFFHSITTLAEVESIEGTFDSKLRAYKIVLTEVAHLFEGLLALMYGTVPPHFDTGKIYVNLKAENDEEQSLLDTGTITRGAGFVLIPEKANYKIENDLHDLIGPATNHIAAFSFFSHALRSLKSNDNEVAFFLFFKIIDGYFSQGAKDVEKALLNKVDEIKEFLPYAPKMRNALKVILSEMGLTSKCESGYEGLIKDLVLIRHKLIHFSSSKSKKHHNALIKIELLSVNNFLYSCCFNLLREKIKVP